MVHQFKEFVENHQLLGTGDPVLLTVSGGVDSVVMTHLFSKAGYKFGIAHCNFGLRAAESELDEIFVRKLASEYKVPFYVKHFDTAGYSRAHGLSIQMAARELRYAWFEEIAGQHHYKYIATAHQLNDQVETFFINLLRGTGLSGLHGINVKHGKVVRPLLFATRDQILEYARNERLEWREDTSNLSRKYLRNRIRLDVLSSLKSIEPDFMNRMSKTFRRLSETETIFRQKIEEGRADLVETSPEGAKILISWLEEFDAKTTWLFELLKPYGFTFPVVEAVAESLEGISGKVFYSATHRLVRDRDYLIIERMVDVHADVPAVFYIDENASGFSGPVNLTFKTADAQDIDIPADPAFATLDIDKLSFPLILRHWKRGDWFIPFGMKGAKKLSDFFIDQKLSIPEKENVWILTSGEDIVWIVGMRIDNRFRITPESTKALIIQLDLPPEDNDCFLGF